MTEYGQMGLDFKTLADFVWKKCDSVCEDDWGGGKDDNWMGAFFLLIKKLLLNDN